MKKRDGVRRCTRCQVSRLSGFICKHTGQQEHFLSIPLLALSSSWCFFRRWYVSSNNVSFFSKKKEEEEKLYLLFFTRQYRPRVVLFNFFFTTVDSCRTDSRTHIRSNALMLGSSLSSSLSGEDRGARVACCCPRGLRRIIIIIIITSVVSLPILSWIEKRKRYDNWGAAWIVCDIRFTIDHRRIIGVDCCLITVYIYHLGCVTDRARNSLRRLGDNRYCDNERYSF